MSEPSERYPSTNARKVLAAKFGLPYADAMQDWEWEVADCARFEEFLAGYRSAEITDDERFSLMEFLLQCVEEMPDEERVASAWRAIESHLIDNMNIHRSTVRYWACVGEQNLHSCFRVAPNMRRLLLGSAD